MGLSKDGHFSPVVAICERFWSVHWTYSQIPWANFRLFLICSHGSWAKNKVRLVTTTQLAAVTETTWQEAFEVQAKHALPWDSLKIACSPQKGRSCVTATWRQAALIGRYSLWMALCSSNAMFQVQVDKAATGRHQRGSNNKGGTSTKHWNGYRNFEPLFLHWLHYRWTEKQRKNKAVGASDRHSWQKVFLIKYRVSFLQPFNFFSPRQCPTL